MKATARRMPRLAGVTHHEVDAGGLRMHVAEAGGGPALVLLHGWPQHWYCWHRVMPLLAGHHRVIAPDLRGFGWSDAPCSGYEKRQLGADVLAALEQLDVEEPCSLVGHDWGGMVGFLLCLDQPDRFERFVALNSGHPWARPGPSQLVSAALRVLPYQSLVSAPFVGGQFVRRVLLPLITRAARARGSWDDAAAATYLEQFGEPARIDATVQLYRSWLVHELPRLGRELRGRRLTVPTLYLHGEEDPVLRPHLVATGVERVAQLQLEFVPGAGHFVQEDAPQFVAERILEHVAAR